MLVKEIGKADESESATERFSDKLLTVLHDLPCLDLTRPEHQAIQPQVCVIRVVMSRKTRSLEFCGEL